MRKIYKSNEVADKHSDYALTLRKGKTIGEQLASAFIYAALAEYTTDVFIKNLADNINKNSSQCKVKFSSNVVSHNGNTNLESALHKLRYFEYPNKIRIEEKIKFIMDARNKLFHDMFRASEKNIILMDKIKIIQDNVPQLKKMLSA